MSTDFAPPALGDRAAARSACLSEWRGTNMLAPLRKPFRQRVIPEHVPIPQEWAVV
jgi:hypothetical protein